VPIVPPSGPGSNTSSPGDADRCAKRDGVVYSRLRIAALLADWVSCQFSVGGPRFWLISWPLKQLWLATDPAPASRTDQTPRLDSSGSVGMASKSWEVGLRTPGAVSSHRRKPRCRPWRWPSCRGWPLLMRVVARRPQPPERRANDAQGTIPAGGYDDVFEPTRPVQLLTGNANSGDPHEETSV
jgi:hypothetical protein